ncbi:MAG: MBL fold metallo-hydrolase [Candidatus Binataceae bacterium]
MKLIFLGTRGYIEARNRYHRRHSSLLISSKGRRIMVDCGEDWRRSVGAVRPHAIFVTHAHPDHCGGLRDGIDCPVYATAAAWSGMNRYKIEQRQTIGVRNPLMVQGIGFEAFSVIHSLRAPAVGYRITADRVAVFYVPDVIDINDRAQALQGIKAFIGDGASMTRPLVRRHGSELFGHTTVRAQLGWCQEASVKQAIFTHCGSQIVKHDERAMNLKLRAMARERGVNARLAYDGLEIVVR